MNNGSNIDPTLPVRLAQAQNDDVRNSKLPTRMSNIVSLSPEHLSKLNQIKPIDIQIHMKREITITPEMQEARKLIQAVNDAIEQIAGFCEKQNIQLGPQSYPPAQVQIWLNSEICKQVQFSE